MLASLLLLLWVTVVFLRLTVHTSRLIAIQAHLLFADPILTIITTPMLIIHVIPILDPLLQAQGDILLPLTSDLAPLGTTVAEAIGLPYKSTS